jgi:hypothetical protein
MIIHRERVPPPIRLRLPGFYVIRRVFPDRQWRRSACDQARTVLAAIESNLEFIMGQLREFAPGSNQQLLGARPGRDGVPRAAPGPLLPGALLPVLPRGVLYSTAALLLPASAAAVARRSTLEAREP